MKHFLFAIAYLLLCFSLTCPAQSYYFYDDRHYEGTLLIEIGAKAGVMNALTDIGGKGGAGKKGLRDLNLSFSRPCFSLFSSIMYNNKIGLRIQYSNGSVMAADSILKDQRKSTHGRYERNLSFQSPVRELALLLEVRPFSFINTDKPAGRFAPVLVGGIGIFSFNPQAKWQGSWYALQPLRTEGQGFSVFPERKPYPLTQRNLLLGLELNYEVNAWLNGRFGIIHRFLPTDYLDDVSLDSYVDPILFARELSASKAGLARKLADRRAEIDPSHTTNLTYQRGNPANHDAYLSLELGLAFVIGRSRR